VPLHLEAETQQKVKPVLVASLLASRIFSRIRELTDELIDKTTGGILHFFCAGWSPVRRVASTFVRDLLNMEFESLARRIVRLRNEHGNLGSDSGG
jgi:hypothetical protein